MISRSIQNEFNSVLLLAHHMEQKRVPYSERNSACFPIRLTTLYVLLKFIVRRCELTGSRHSLSQYSLRQTDETYENVCGASWRWWRLEHKPWVW